MDAARTHWPKRDWAMDDSSETVNSISIPPEEQPS
jgi:hypothetical protein